MLNEVDDALSKRVHAVARVQRYLKNSFIAFGSLLVGGFGAFSAASSWPPSAIQVAILFGALLTFVGGLVGIFSEQDPTELIDIARREAHKAEAEAALSASRRAKLKIFHSTVNELKSLYLVYNTCRGTLETALTHDTTDEIKLIENCLQGSRHDLRVALSLEMSDYWTLCVYRAEKDVNEDITLRCVAHLRSVDCNIENARTWAVGVGIAGITYAKNSEVREPDVFAPKAGSSYMPNDSTSRPSDDDKYRSMFGVPIRVGSDTTSWGVIVATSSNSTHFGNDKFEGLPPEEAVRTLAGVAAMAVAICRSNNLQTSTIEEIKSHGS